MKPAESEFVDSPRWLWPDNPVMSHFCSVLSTAPELFPSPSVRTRNSHQKALALNRCKKDCDCFEIPC